MVTVTAETPVAAPPKRTPGLYPGVSYGDYASRFEGARASTLKHFERSAAHARQETLYPRTSKDMEFGTAWHTAALEPEAFAAGFVRELEGFDFRTTEGKAARSAFRLQHGGKAVVAAGDFDRIVAMAELLHQHETAAGLLSARGANEVVALWDDAQTGVRCRARIDRFCEFMGWSWVIDLKTTVNASSQGWPREVQKYAYAEAAAFYLDGLEALDPRPRRFLWLAQEKQPPFAVAIHEPDDETLAYGRRRYRRHLRAYAEAMRTDCWPAYPAGVLPTSLPGWAIREESQRPDEDDEETEETA